LRAVSFPKKLLAHNAIDDAAHTDRLPANHGRCADADTDDAEHTGVQV
jgi:hypothetical protein